MRSNQEFLPARQRRGTEMSFGNPGSMMSPATLFSASPWQMMRQMQEDMDRLFSQLVGGSPGSDTPPARGGQQTGILQWSPSVDLSESDKEWIVEAELPGVKPDDIDVRVQDHHLILRAELRQEEQSPDGQGQGSQAQGGQAQGSQAQGAQARGGQTQGQPGQGQQGAQRQYHHRERRYGFFQRVFPLPENADEEHIRCEFQNGVLTLHIPKMEPANQQVRRIAINGGEQAQRGPGNGRSERREPAMAGARGGEASSPEASSQGPGASGQSSQGAGASEKSGQSKP